MREIVVVSGKGGTGKTSLSAAFAHLASDPVICDLDVDAPDLHLLLQPDERQSRDFYAGHTAQIIVDHCDDCGTCAQVCRFNAVKPGDAHPEIDPLRCEGCKVCVHFCPADAITFTPKHCGTWFQSRTRFGTMLHAQLFPAEENSGRLVALLRQKAREIAKAHGRSIVLSDGPPGIGCPVISALSGVHLAVIVTEPTPSGLHDLERVRSLCDYFNIPVALVINKFDLNADISAQIKSFCYRDGVRVVAEIPHDPIFVNAMVHGQAVTEYAEGQMAETIRVAWGHIVDLAGCAGIREPVADQRRFVYPSP